MFVACACSKSCLKPESHVDCAPHLEAIGRHGSWAEVLVGDKHCEMSSCAALPTTRGNMQCDREELYVV